MPVTNLIPGSKPIFIRQKVDTDYDFTGVAPYLGETLFVLHDYHDNIYAYGDPDDFSVDTGEAGGLFLLGNQACEIVEIEADTGGIFSVTLSDSDGHNEITVVDQRPGKAHREAFLPGIRVLPNQQVKIYSEASLREYIKTVTLCVVKAPA